jgi:hypothetical protein
VPLHCKPLPLQLPSRLLVTAVYWVPERLAHASDGVRQPQEVPIVANPPVCLQAELANQIDPLMLRVLEKCQKHRDQVQGCQVRMLPFPCPEHAAATLSDCAAARA